MTKEKNKIKNEKIAKEKYDIEKEKKKTTKKKNKLEKDDSVKTEKKVLGGSKYSNSKKKKQKIKKIVKDTLIRKKNSSLKIKIKNLQKEIKRIQNCEEIDSKALKDLDDKLEKLIKINKENFKKNESAKDSIKKDSTKE